LIKNIIPQTKYEKESFVKSFLLFFLSIEILLGVIAYLFFKNEVAQLKNQIYLEMKNYSYLFKGDKFDLKLLENVDNKSFYQLYEDEKSLYIIVPIPFSKKEALKIEYPKEKFQQRLLKIKKRIISIFIGFSVISFILSIIFALYSLYPVRKGISLIDEFIKDIIHDLNTPISTILINLKLLKLKHKQDEEIDRIGQASNQLVMTYENLKFLSKESEKNFKEVRLDSIIKEIVEGLKNLYPDIKIQIDLKPVNLQTDETAVRRIISNLIYNAFKHNVKNGWIKIQLDKNFLIIKNSSKNIKNPDKVFERYYKESQRGMGIGLSIVKKLCKELNWDIEFNYKDNIVSVQINFQ